jgi:hypothetical protein
LKKKFIKRGNEKITEIKTKMIESKIPITMRTKIYLSG